MLLLALVTASSAVYAQPKKLAILPAVVEGAHGQVSTTELFEIVQREADFRKGLDLLSYNALFIDGVETIAKTVRECGSEVPCIAKAMALANIDLGLRVIVNFAIEPPLITFNLIDAKDQKVIAESLAEQDERALAGILRDQTADLLDKGNYTRGGRLMLDVKPPDARVDIRPTGVVGAVVDVGKYQVTATKEGFHAQTVDVDVRAGEEALATLLLEQIPPEPTIVESPWLWTAVGVAVVGGVAAVLIATDPFSKDPTTGTLCVTTAQGSCP